MAPEFTFSSPPRHKWSWRYERSSPWPADVAASAATGAHQSPTLTSSTTQPPTEAVFSWHKEKNMTTQFTDELLSVEAVASAPDCADTTVEEHARTGHLPGIKLGRSWVFPRTALLQSLCSNGPEPG